MTNELKSSIFTRGEIVAFAHMPETGDYATDCATGRCRADDLISRIAETGCTPALQHVVRVIVEQGRWEAVHIGFFQKLAEHSLPTRV